MGFYILVVVGSPLFTYIHFTFSCVAQRMWMICNLLKIDIWKNKDMWDSCIHYLNFFLKYSEAVRLCDKENGRKKTDGEEANMHTKRCQPVPLKISSNANAAQTIVQVQLNETDAGSSCRVICSLLMMFGAFAYKFQTV